MELFILLKQRLEALHISAQKLIDLVSVLVELERRHSSHACGGSCFRIVVNVNFVALDCGVLTGKLLKE